MSYKLFKRQQEKFIQDSMVTTALMNADQDYADRKAHSFCIGHIELHLFIVRCLE